MNTPKSKHYRPSRDPISRFESEMKLRGYSHKTIKSYLHYISACLCFANIGPREIRETDVRAYLQSLDSRGLSASTMNLAYSALRLYFGSVLHRRFFVRLPRFKKKTEITACFVCRAGGEADGKC